jgi:hypothetical protein
MLYRGGAGSDLGGAVMPIGKVVRYDKCSGDVRIEARRRKYASGASDIEPDVRFRGAVVCFDIERTRDGDRAVRVVPMPGLRPRSTSIC